MYKKAIYFETHPAQGLEFKMIEHTTQREVILSAIEVALAELKDLKGTYPSDDIIIKNFFLYNSLREATFNLIEQILRWQHSFTKLRRPRLRNMDYLAKISETGDFICSSQINRIFKFQIARGNIFVLPTAIGANNRVFNGSLRLAQEIIQFTSPPHDRLSKAYLVLRECLPDAIMKTIMPLDEYIRCPWIAQISLTIPPSTSNESSDTHSQGQSQVSVDQNTSIQSMDNSSTKSLGSISSDRKQSVSFQPFPPPENRYTKNVHHIHENGDRDLTKSSHLAASSALSIMSRTSSSRTIQSIPGTARTTLPHPNNNNNNYYGKDPLPHYASIASGRDSLSTHYNNQSHKSPPRSAVPSVCTPAMNHTHTSNALPLSTTQIRDWYLKMNPIEASSLPETTIKK